MNEIYIWVKNILMVIIAISFFQMLVPESSMAKYVKFVFSLLILATILEPAVKLAVKI